MSGTRPVRKVFGRFEYLDDRSRNLDVIWQPVRGELTTHPWTVTLPVGLDGRQWEAVHWACVLCDRRIHNDRASRSTSSRQCAYPFCSSRAGFCWQSITSPSSVSALQSRFGSLRLLSFPKAKIAAEREEICECDGHTVHKLSQRRLTAEWLAPRESDGSRMHSKVSSDWLPRYSKATRPVLEILKKAGCFPDSPRICGQLRKVRALATCVPHTDACCGAFGQGVICALTGLDAGPR